MVVKATFKNKEITTGLKPFQFLIKYNNVGRKAGLNTIKK
jgi:hypothetical protein